MFISILDGNKIKFKIEVKYGENIKKKRYSSVNFILTKEDFEISSTPYLIPVEIFLLAFWVGYKKTTGIRNFRGLKVVPMKKVLLRWKEN